MASASKTKSIRKTIQNMRNTNAEAYARQLVDSGRMKGNMPKDKLVSLVARNLLYKQNTRNTSSSTNRTVQSQKSPTRNTPSSTNQPVQSQKSPTANTNNYSSQRINGASVQKPVSASTQANPYANEINNNTNSLNGIDTNYGNWYQNYANQVSNNGALQAIENARKNMTDLTNRQYDTNARNYYAQYRINENNLPEKLSNLGVTGGASETAQLALMNNYSGNLYNNETARANALNSGNMQYDQLVANNSKELANQLASTYLSLAKEAQANKVAQADKAYERAWNEDARNYDRAWNEEARSYDRNWNEDARSYDRVWNENARKYERYMTDMENTLAFCNMVGRYDNMLGYGWSQAMVDKANKAAQEAKSSVTYSGGGGGYGGYSYGGSSDSYTDDGWVDPSGGEETTPVSSTSGIVPTYSYGGALNAIKTDFGSGSTTTKSNPYNWTAPNVQTTTTTTRSRQGILRNKATTPTKKNTNKSANNAGGNKYYK